jgi:hypothetical protein
MPKQKSDMVAAPSLGLILQWMLNHEWWRLGIGEDPHWGQQPTDQIVILTAIHDLAKRITDQKVRKEVQATIANGMANVVKRMVKENR